MILQRGLVDIRPLRSSPAFRRLWFSGVLAITGGQVMMVAVLYQVWELTGSPIWTGAIGIVRAVPLIVCGVLGGAIADAVDRRSLVRVTTTVQACVGLGLAIQVLAGWDSLAVLFALVALGAGTGAVDAPARRTFVPRLLAREEVMAGVALQHLSVQGAMLLGPAIGGVLIGWWDVSVCFGVHAAAVLASLYGIIRLPSMAVAEGARRPGFRAIAEGFTFVRSRAVLRGAFGIDLGATLLAMPVALFPLVNEVRFGGSPETLGLFLSCVAIGGMLAGLTSGWVTRADRPGVVQLCAAGTWGLALTVFGLAGPVWLAMGMLVLAGGADTILVVSRGGMVQMVTPDTHRGRVNALEHTLGVAGPELGNARGGLVAQFTSAPFALVSGGLSSILVIALIAWRNRPMRTFRLSTVEDE